MTILVERLRTTPTARTWDSVGRPYDYPKHLPLEAADRIEALERENAELRERVDRLRSDRAYVIGVNDGWASAIEEAAKVVDSISHDGLHGSMWEQKFRAAATAIRALSVPSPTPLQEQNANSGKEGE